MDIGGPITRTVEDCALTLQAIAGYDARDPYTADQPVPDYRAGLDGQIKGLRLGIVQEAVNADFIHPQVKVAITQAITELEDLGATLTEVSIPLLASAAAITRAVLAVESAALHHDWLRTRLHEYDHNVQLDFLTGSILPAQLYYKAQQLHAVLRRQVLDLFQQVDVLAELFARDPRPEADEG